MRDYLIICFVILVFVIDVVKKKITGDFFTKIKIIFSPLRSDTCCFFLYHSSVCAIEFLEKAR